MIVDRINDFLLPGRSWYHRNITDVKAITIHHDAIPFNNQDDETRLKRIMDTHTGKGWPGASYHFWIGRTGTIYQLNYVERKTWHDSVNTDSIGVCVTGYHHPNYNNTPSPKQLESLYWLINFLHDKYGNLTVRGHRDVSSTACPGDNLYPLIHNYKKEEDSKMIKFHVKGYKDIEVSKESFDEVKEFANNYRHFREELSKCEKERDEYKKDNKDLKSELEENQQTIKKLKSDIKTLDDSLAEQTAIVAGMEDACQERIRKQNTNTREFLERIAEVENRSEVSLTFVEERYKQYHNETNNKQLTDYSSSQLVTELINRIFKRGKNV
jgi:N-acetyl-anhydromuramyl-L-alanine amidase AmpD